MPVRVLGYEVGRRAGGLGLTVRSAGPVPVRSSLWGWVRESFSGAWQRGITIEPMGGLMSSSTPYACTTRIANDIAKLGLLLKQYQPEPDGISVPVPRMSPFWIVLLRPNSYQNHIQFVSRWIIAKLMHGNAYGIKVRDARGIVTAVYPLDPRRVTPLVTPEGDVFYSLGGDNLARVPTGAVVPASEIIHDRMNCLWHDLIGIPPLYAAALSATQALKIQRNSAIFFENMSRPSGMLTAPKTIDPVTAARLKEEWEQNYSADNIGRLAIAGDGLKYEPMTLGAETSQLIEQLGWTVADIARAYGMPLYKIGAGPMPTAGNVAALNQQYYNDALQTLIEDFEQCFNDGLGLPADYGVEFDLEGLLRMDASSLIDYIAKAIGAGAMTPNEGRRKLNLKPVPGGDTVYLQEQNHSLEALSKRDAGPDPFGTAAPAAPALPAPAADDADDAADDEAAKAFILAVTAGLVHG